MLEVDSFDRMEVEVHSFGHMVGERRCSDLVVHFDRIGHQTLELVKTHLSRPVELLVCQIVVVLYRALIYSAY